MILDCLITVVEMYFIVAALAALCFVVVASFLPPNIDGELEPFPVVVAASVVLGIIWPWSCMEIAEMYRGRKM